MTYATVGADRFPLDRGRFRRRVLSKIAFGSITLAFSGLMGAWILGLPAKMPILDAAPVAPVTLINAPAVKATAPATAASATYLALLDPSYSLGPAPVGMGQQPAPLAPAFEANWPAPEVASVTPIPEPQIVAAIAAEPELGQTIPLPVQAPQLAENIPLPAPRPDFAASMRQGRYGTPEAQGRFGLPGRRMAQLNRRAAPSATPTDDRNFLEKFFGMGQTPGPALGYAAADDAGMGIGQRMTSSPMRSYDRLTAVYNIAERTVYMPNGQRLEAHSGLGSRLDDPRHVAERNVGPTPPAVYDLQPREALFHGVRALRLTPVSGGVFGRNGLLAHTYMLGPNGDSNGCVSFRNYDAFLQAYLNGQVRRLVVVAGSV